MKFVGKIVGNKYLVFSLLILIVLIIAVYARVQLATSFWNTTHLFPIQVLWITKDAQQALHMGDYYFEIGSTEKAYDIDLADSIYTLAVSLDEEVHYAWYRRARIAFLRSDFERALDYLDKQYEITEDDFMDVYYMRGLVQGFMGDLDSAVKNFEKYRIWDNKSWYVHNNLAWLYFRRGEFQKMDAISIHGLVYNADNPWLLMNRGMAQYNLGNISAAKELLLQAQNEASKLTKEEWSKSYPGNDPKIAAQGLSEFQNLIQDNLNLVHSIKQ